MSAFHLVLDLETVPDPALSAPLQSDRLRDLLSQLPRCSDCHEPAEWRRAAHVPAEDTEIWRSYCETHKLWAVMPCAPELSRKIAEVRAELSKSSTFGKPAEHKIVCAGYAWIEDYRVTSHGLLGLPPQDEIQALKTIAQAVSHADPVVVTFNGRTFDLPVLAARCFHHGIPHPWYWDETRWKHPRYRYSESKHLDVMDLLSGHGAAKNSSQDLWARAAGLPGKGSGPTGADVAGMYSQGEHEQIGAYCLSDVLQLAGIFLRVQLTRGLLPLSEYQAAAAALFETMGSDERTRPLCAEIDLDRFLMREGRLADAEREMGGSGDAAATAPGARRAAGRKRGAPGAAPGAPGVGGRVR